MRHDCHSCSSSTLLTFLAGAVVGGFVVALATPRSGPELRGDLRDFADRARRRAGKLVEEARDGFDEVKQRTAQAASDLKRGIADSVEDLRG